MYSCMRLPLAENRVKATFILRLYNSLHLEFLKKLLLLPQNHQSKFIFCLRLHCPYHLFLNNTQILHFHEEWKCIVKNHWTFRHLEFSEVRKKKRKKNCSSTRNPKWNNFHCCCWGIQIVITNYPIFLRMLIKKERKKKSRYITVGKNYYARR